MKKLLRTTFMIVSVMVTLYFLVVSCADSKSKEEKTTPSKKSTTVALPQKLHEVQYDPVVFNVSSTDTTALKYFNLLNYDYFFGTNQKAVTDRSQNGQLVLEFCDVASPKIMEVMAIGTNHMYGTKLLVVPGDTVHMELKEGKILFAGKNAHRFRFFSKIDTVRSEWIPYEGNLQAYKQKWDATYKKQLRFIEDYTTAHADEITPEMKEELLGEFKFRHLLYLIDPQEIKKVFGGKIDHDNNVFAQLPDSEYAQTNSELEMFDAKAYFNNIQLSEFQRPDLIDNDYYKRALVNYLRFYFVNHDYIDYSRAAFEKEKTFIENHLEGDIKAYAMGRLITDYFKKGFGSSTTNIKRLNSVIDTFKTTVTNASYLYEIDSIQKSLNSFNTKIPYNALNEQLLSSTGDTVLVKDVLLKEDERIKVIDFWASWCTPCVNELNQTRTIRKQLSKENQITFIYVSSDLKKDQWLKAQKRYELDAHSYLLLGDIKESSLLAAFHVVFIPKYAIVDTDGNIVTNDAPRVSDTRVFQKVISAIKEGR